MSWLTVLLFCLAAGAAYYYFLSLRLREIAIERTRKHCTSMSVQLLDQSVSLKKIGFARDQSGQLTLSNSYEFEFSTTGDERYRGSIVLHGHRVHSVWLQPHRLPDQDPLG